MKRMFLIAAVALCVFAAQAQNKVFEKYSQMEGVEYVCINKAMFSAGLSLATAGQIVLDEANRPLEVYQFQPYADYHCQR